MLANKQVRYLVMAALVLVVAIGLGAWTAAAQGPMGQGGRGMMHGHHGMGQHMMGQGGMMMGGQAMLETLAAALNLEPAELTAELQAGKTLTEIATEQGVEPQVLTDAILAARQAHLNLMVEQGYMTQEQVDLMLEHMTEEIPEHLDGMFSGNGWGMGWHGGW
jgi:hypothetical protein